MWPNHCRRPVAYFEWLKNLATLNLGESYETGEPVWDRIRDRFPISLTFGLTGFILAYLVCIPLGIAKALRHGSPFDFVSSAVVFIGYSSKIIRTSFPAGCGSVP